MQYTPSVDKQASHFVHIPGLSYSGVKSPTECQQSLFESHFASRSEERFSRNAETELVCRLLLEKKKGISAEFRGCQGQVRFFALHRIEPHAPPLVRVPVNSFEFQPCGRTPQADDLTR